MHGHRDVVVELSGWSLFGPLNARWLDAREFASLKDAPEGARFEPDTLATPNGLLRLSETSLIIDQLFMKTRDDRTMNTSIRLRFALQRSIESLRVLVSNRIIETLPCELPSRVTAAVRAEISRLNYHALQAEFGEIEARVLKQLRASICGSPQSGSERLGLTLSALAIDLYEDASHGPDGGGSFINTPSFITQTAAAIRAADGDVKMSDIVALTAGHYSLEQTRALAKAPNGFMIAPQHLGGFDPNGGIYSPLLNPALGYLATTGEPGEAPYDPAPRAEAKGQMKAPRLMRRNSRNSRLKMNGVVGRDFDPGHQIFRGPM